MCCVSDSEELGILKLTVGLFLSLSDFRGGLTGSEFNCFSGIGAAPLLFVAITGVPFFLTESGGNRSGLVSA